MKIMQTLFTKWMGFSIFFGLQIYLNFLYFFRRYKQRTRGHLRRVRRNSQWKKAFLKSPLTWIYFWFFKTKLKSKKISFKLFSEQKTKFIYGFINNLATFWNCYLIDKVLWGQGCGTLPKVPDFATDFGKHFQSNIVTVLLLSSL